MLARCTLHVVAHGLCVGVRQIDARQTLLTVISRRGRRIAVVPVIAANNTQLCKSVFCGVFACDVAGRQRNLNIETTRVGVNVQHFTGKIQTADDFTFHC